MSTSRQVAEFLVSKSADKVLALGPLVRQPVNGGSAKRWYFVAGSADEASEFHVGQIIVNGDDDRFALLAELVAYRPLVVHDFDDELVMARFCEAIWPCPKASRIRKKLERERA
jgi:hypothetical protein